MRVAYFDLGFSKEQYGLQPTRYGGGAVAARYLKEESDIEFHVFAPTEAFANMGPTERRSWCHDMGPLVCETIQRGFPLSSLYNVTYWGPFDLILHPHTCHTINRGSLNVPVVHFCGFDGAAGHPGNDYVLLYDPSFRAQFGERPKYVRIGKPVPPEYPGYAGREKMVFQCSRHDDHLNTVALAKQCLAEGFKGVFAGPIHGAYPLRDYIDDKTTFYLGEISEREKLDWCRRASLYGMLHAWPQMPFNQSVIEAQGEGTPLYTLPKGPFLASYLIHGVNGFDADKISLTDAYKQANEEVSIESWRAASRYSVPVMTQSFKKAFREIVDEWRKMPSH